MASGSLPSGPLQNMYTSSGNNPCVALQANSRLSGDDQAGIVADDGEMHLAEPSSVSSSGIVDVISAQPSTDPNPCAVPMGDMSEEPTQRMFLSQRRAKTIACDTFSSFNSP